MLVGSPYPNTVVFKGCMKVNLRNNVTVNTGTEYKARVMTIKDLELLCKTGHNSNTLSKELLI